MKRSVLFGVLALVFACGAALAVAACSTTNAPGAISERVRTEKGLVKGVVADGVISFKGIPYAAAPTGERRWKRPQPAATWSGAFSADAFGPTCPQPVLRNRPGASGVQDEDCLTLNIWAPENATGAPVMVWIHGGAFRIGSGRLPYYDGTSLAKRGVVLVTLNYRLGAFGFFAHEALRAEEGGSDAPANFGLLDQVAALEWVKKEITGFGGDPDNVTIFGESAGGASVLYLLASEKAEGLFQKAIVQSGGGGQMARCAWSACAGSPAESAATEKLLAAKGMSGATSAQLRAMSVGAVLDLAPLSRGVGYGPIIDGDVVAANISERFEMGVASDKPVIIGSNSDEASVLASFGSNTADVVAQLGVGAAVFRRVYQSKERGLNDKRLGAEVFRDAAFGAPARRAAATLSAEGGAVWRYYYDYVLERRRGNSDGAGHGTEIPMVFGTLDTIPAARLLISDADREVSSVMMDLWVSFARTGEPSSMSVPDWPQTDEGGDPVLIIDADGARTESGFQKDTLDLQDRVAAARAAG